MKTVGTVLLTIGFLLQILSGLLALACLGGSFWAAFSGGGVVGFLLMLGLSVVVGFAGKWGGGALMLLGATLQERT